MWEFWRGKLGSKGRTSPRTTSSAGSPRHSEAAQRRAAAVVNFKDLNLSVDDELSEDPLHPDYAHHEDEDPTNKFAIIRTKSLRSGAQKNKLIIIMVGLPGRGKTFLCNKLKCYLNWLGHNTAHFNVGNYRRSQKEANEVQNAEFFDSHNQHGVEARSRALMAAVEDVMRFLGEAGQVAIFDATNTTKERRQMLINFFHGRSQYIFIESICNDSQVLEDNYRYKMKFSPDYQGVDTEAALQDFKQRINKYNEVYEPINDRRLHYIKLIDMVTGRGYMDVNRISGYIPGKIVFFLMQVCKAGMHAGQSRKIWLTRHGESQFNQAQRIGGDSGLTARGEEYARLLPDVLESRLPATFNESGVPVSIWTSTLRRTIATANYLPYPKLRWKALDEIHAGVCDGMTYAEIAQKFPEDYEARKRDKLRYRYPSGESYLDVVQRLEPVIIEMEREREYICVVGHQAILRAIFGYFMAVPLDTVPRLDIPLHTLIELQPRADGTMEVSFLPVAIGAPVHSITAHSKPPPTAGVYHGQQQQQQQHPHGASPPTHHQHSSSGGSFTGAFTGALNGLKPLVSHTSLPPGFLGMRGSPRKSKEISHPSAAAATAAGSSGGSSSRFHRRTASGSAAGAVQQGGGGTGGGLPNVASFATVSSMGSFSGLPLSNSSSQGSLGGSSGGTAAPSAAAATGTPPLQGGFMHQAAAGQQQQRRQSADTGVLHRGHPVGGPSSSSSSSSSSHQRSASASATAAAEPRGFGVATQLEPDAQGLAEINAQGLALDESFMLTSAASDFAAAAAAAGLGGGVGGEGSSSGGGSGALSDTSSGPMPVLGAVIGSMNSLD